MASNYLEEATLRMDERESGLVRVVVHIIDDFPGRITYAELIRKACDAGVYPGLRYLKGTLHALIREHNAKFE